MAPKKFTISVERSNRLIETKSIFRVVPGKCCLFLNFKTMNMGKAKKILFAIVVVCFIFVLPAMGDQPPDPGGDPTGDPVGGGSPLGGGLIIMMMAGLGYGFQKLRMMLKK
jgi:hypothetical protein